MLKIRSFFALLLISVLISSGYSGPLGDRKNIRTRRETDLCYASVLDAGSSKTKVYVFSWVCRDGVQIPRLNLESIFSSHQNRPLTNFTETVDKIPSFLDIFIKQIKEIIPDELHSSSPIMIGATAGLRSLNTTQQNEIIKQVNFTLSSSGFLFAGKEWGKVISGQEEGNYLWISTNYILGAIKDNSQNSLEHIKTAATIDLGGASTQITFQVTQLDEINDNISLPQNNEYNLYSKSYMNYGNDKARNKVVHLDESEEGEIHSGCYNSGYNFTDSKNLVVGTSEPQQCLQKIRKYLSKENCKNNDPKRCSIKGDFLPEVPTDGSVIAVSGIFNAVRALKVKSPFHPNQLLQAAINYCNLTYEELKIKTKFDENYSKNNCFLGLYAASLLSEGYNLGSYKIISQDKINGSEPSWAMGYLIYNLSNLKCDKQTTVPSDSCPKGN